MAIDFDELLVSAAASPTAAEIKESLPIPYVLERFDVPGAIDDNGNYRATCPWHDDRTPSLDVYGQHFERWGCFPCGIGGDVFDILERLGGGSTFTETSAAAEQLLADLRASDWQGPSKAAPKLFDVKAAADRVQAAVLAAQQTDNALATFVSDKGYDFDADWLAATFQVGADSGSVIIPHFDRAGLVGYKHRASARHKPYAASGAKFTCLYGTWRDTGTRTVLLCEGESDVWAATYAVGGSFDVLGLPTGAGTHPDKFVPQIAERDVIIAFDGDDAGRKALRRWHPALLNAGCTVRVCPLPDDMDLAKLPNIAEVVARARAVPTHPEQALLPISGGYGRKSGDGHTMVSNWIFEARRELLAEDGSLAYEGVVLPTGHAAVLSSADLSSKSQIVKWSNNQGGAWFGSDRDAQILLAMLQAEGPFLPTGRMTVVAGLHEWHFIAPGVKIGPDYWQYVPPAGDVELAKDVNIRPGAWDPEQVHILRDLHSRAVMDPLLAWLAAAPIRSVLHSFPYLGVTGSAGTGKSTLLEVMLRQFTGTHITTNLTSTTRYAVSAMAEATNGIPVWFDEYRPGARFDTITAVNQILRDAFDGAASARGGTKDHWAKVTRRAATAPLIVSGEDTFEETSLVQRMVALPLPLEGKNPATLERVQGWPTHGLPYAYLEWLIGSVQLGRLWRFENYERGPESLPSRNRIGLGVLDLGWRLLSRFVDEHGGRELGAPDFSLVVGEAAEAALSSPIEDAIRWALDETDAFEFIGRRGQDVWIRVTNFVPFVTKDNKFRLPGGGKAIRKYLVQHYGAVDTTLTGLGGQKRALRIPEGVSKLGLLDE